MFLCIFFKISQFVCDMNFLINILMLSIYMNVKYVFLIVSIMSTLKKKKIENINDFCEIFIIIL